MFLQIKCINKISRERIILKNYSIPKINPLKQPDFRARRSENALKILPGLSVSRHSGLVPESKNDKNMAPAYDTVNGAPVGAAFCRPSLADANSKV
jgi:hypothetical protein